MEIEKQVCSLKLAKRLKRLGVKEGYFCWVEDLSYMNRDDVGNKSKAEVLGTQVRFSFEYFDLLNNPFVNIYPAFTVAELGLMFPPCVNNIDWYSKKVETFNEKERQIEIKFGMWFLDFDEVAGKTNKHATLGETEADARAKTLIYLLENKLIEI